MDPLDLAKVTELFLTPSSILVGALGVAHTEQLKTGVSSLGLISSVFWAVCAVTALPDPVPALRYHLVAWLPFAFILGWLISVIVHATRWSKGK